MRVSSVCPVTSAPRRCGRTVGPACAARPSWPCLPALGLGEQRGTGLWGCFSPAGLGLCATCWTWAGGAPRCRSGPGSALWGGGNGPWGQQCSAGLSETGSLCLSCLPVNGEEAGSSWELRARWAGAAERGRAEQGSGSNPVIPHKLLYWPGAVLPGELGSRRCCSGTSRGVHPPHQPLSPQMAQRLALQRLLAFPTRGPLASHGRAFGTSAGRRNTFNVQDGSDFQDRVVNSPKPVVVDFHAQ